MTFFFFLSELDLTQIRSSQIQIESTQFVFQVLLLIELTVTQWKIQLHAY